MRLLTALAALLLAGEQTPQPLNLKLGLWQLTYTEERSGAPVPRNIPSELSAKMTPPQRARTQAKLRANAAAGPRPYTKRFCLTEEKLSKGIFSDDDLKSCQRTILTANGKLQQFRDECDEAGTKVAVEAKFEALEPATLKGTKDVKVDGNISYTMNVEIGGKWIGPDCGSQTK